MSREKVILAYSGGLDTSVAIHWLKEEKGFDVVAVLVDVGQGKELKPLAVKASKIGAVKTYCVDAKREFIEQYVWPALQAHAVYEGKYTLATALSRPLIAKKLIDIARKEKATAVAHGCTGKGNDQVRFDMAVLTLAPELTIIAPLREWELMTREEEIEYAQARGIPVPVKKKSPYSIDRNLWGISIECGVLEDPDTAPPEEAYQWTQDPLKAPRKSVEVEIAFQRGIPYGFNGKKMSSLSLIEKLNQLGARYGIGRIDSVENRLVGIKSREIYEAPAATILLQAHRELEMLNLDRELFQFKETLGPRYAQLVYNGQWFTPLREALDGFIRQTQYCVSGVVRMRLYPGFAACVGRTSAYSRYSKSLATYEQGDQFDRKIAEGFIKVWAMPYKN
ncbi:MAG: argininosuccinate synthase [Candidatus Omnitrophica bacterium]|nr:argininosuccinate synthase [Candidatus Omnitrophota bacterium]